MIPITRVWPYVLVQAVIAGIWIFSALAIVFVYRVH